MKADYVRPAVQISPSVVMIAACLCCIVGALVALAIYRLTSVPL